MKKLKKKPNSFKVNTEWEREENSLQLVLAVLLCDDATRRIWEIIEGILEELELSLSEEDVESEIEIGITVNPSTIVSA
jgi:hypothetical protein